MRPSDFKFVHAVLEELGAGDIQSQINILARAVSGLVDGFQYRGDRRFVGRQVGCEAALIADRGVQALAMQNLLQGVKHFGAVAHRLRERRRADGQES